MSKQSATESIRINADVLAKIRKVLESNGQSILWYASSHLEKQADKDLARIEKKKFSPNK